MVRRQPLDKEQLKQIGNLIKEIECIKKQLETLSSIVLVDKVKGSSKVYPYTPRNFTIEGIDRYKVYKLEKKLQRRIDELMDVVEDINNFITEIPDSLTRQIISLRYINNLTWEQVAESIGGNNTADSVRKVAERFLK